jgi:hypothetical protein
MPIGNVIAPARSWPPPGSGLSFGTKIKPMITAIRANGTENRKVQRQLTVVIRPPTIRPRENPEAPNVEKIEIALLRAGPSAKLVVMIERPAGVMNAAAAPVTEPAVRVAASPRGAHPPLAAAAAAVAAGPAVGLCAIKADMKTCCGPYASHRPGFGRLMTRLSGIIH